MSNFVLIETLIPNSPANFKGLSLTMQSVCTNASAHARIDGMFKNEIQYETNYKMNKKLECMSRRSKSSYGYESTQRSHDIFEVAFHSLKIFIVEI